MRASFGNDEQKPTRKKEEAHKKRRKKEEEEIFSILKEGTTSPSRLYHPVRKKVGKVTAASAAAVTGGSYALSRCGQLLLLAEEELSIPSFSTFDTLLRTGHAVVVLPHSDLLRTCTRHPPFSGGGTMAFMEEPRAAVLSSGLGESAARLERQKIFPHYEKYAQNFFRKEISLFIPFVKFKVPEWSFEMCVPTIVRRLILAEILCIETFALGFPFMGNRAGAIEVSGATRSRLPQSND